MPKTPVTKLQLSSLKPNRQMFGDIDLDSLNLAQRGVASAHLRDRIISAEVERTIEGASTVKIIVKDHDKSLQRSGRLHAKADIQVDGLWFRLVAVGKVGNDLTLTFEDREVAILRTYKKPKHVAWGKTTRAWFAWNLVREVKEVRIGFMCPELEKPKKKPIKTKKARKSPAQREQEKDLGFSPNDDITVKGKPATEIQRRNIDLVLQAGASQIVRRKLLVCAVMCITQESSALTSATNGVHVGLFQQNPAYWPATRQAERDASAFFERIKRLDSQYPNLDYAELVEKVQNSGEDPHRTYGKWRLEAERTVTKWGSAGDDQEKDEAVYNTNLAAALTDLEGAGNPNYQFTRGRFTTKNGREVVERENSWDCLGRLAEEINWRRFMVAGTMYFISEPQLFKSAPIMRISEDDDGIDWIDYDYDTGKPSGKVTVHCRIDRWDAPPGAVIWINEQCPAEGRWIVHSFRRSLFSKDAEITLKKPRPKLPEPAQESDRQTDWASLLGQVDSGTSISDLPSDIKLFPFRKNVQFRKGGGPEAHRSRAIGNWYSDNAVDIMAPANTTVHAVENCTIGPVTRRVSNGRGTEDGSTVFLQADSGEWWCYMHLNPPPGNIKAGSKLKAGEIVGTLGALTAGGPHLHLGRKNGPPEEVYDYQRVGEKGDTASAPPHKLRP